MNLQDHMRKIIILGKQGSGGDGAFYQIGSGIPPGGNKESNYPSNRNTENNLHIARYLRHQQETLMRSQFMTGHQPLMCQPGMQTVPSQLESRHLSPTAGILAPADLRQIHVASTLEPPASQFASFPNLLSSCVSQGPGYSFLQSESMEAVAKRQELIQKQNIARMEMSAILQQKELEKAQRKCLLKLRGFSPYPDVPACSASFQERHYIPEGHLSSGLYVHQAMLNELQRNAMAMAMGTSSYPPLTMLQRERVRRPSRRPGIRKASRYQFNHGKNPMEDRDTDVASVTLRDEKEDKKETRVEMPSKPPEAEQEVHEEPSAAVTKNKKECEGGLRKNLCNRKMPREAIDGHNGNEKDPRNSCLVFNDKHADPSKVTFSALTSGFSMLNPPPLSFAPPRLILNGEEISSAEFIRKWTVEDVYSFINGLPGCSDYAQVFKDHAIDGEILPLLTEEHLLDMMGLKLGPALKIQSQVSQCLRNIFCTMNIPLAMPNPHITRTPSEPFHNTVSQLPCNSAHTALASPYTQDPETSKTVEQVISESPGKNLL